MDLLNEHLDRSADTSILDMDRPARMVFTVGLPLTDF